MSWLWITLVSAFSLASADAATKGLLRDCTTAELVLVRFGVAGLLLTPFVLVQPWPSLPLPFWGWVGALVPLELLAMYLYMRAISTSPLALTLPYQAFTPVFVAGIGYLVLGERISPRGLAGVALVALGAYLLNVDQLRGGGRSRALAPLRAIWREPGSRMMLGAAGLYALTSVMGKAALRYAPPTFFGPFYFMLLGGITLAAALAGPGRARVLVRRPGGSLVVGVLMAAMVVSHFVAVARVDVAYMIAVKRTSLLFGILYGAILFREGGLRRHLGAGVLMVAGVALIAV
ncbi:MAG TPA: DMT family transporter [Gammaproteobacteria bacterium]|nr:DMT family transporter [Gammaproteobacteria bacterium]